MIWAASSSTVFTVMPHFFQVLIRKVAFALEAALVSTGIVNLISVLVAGFSAFHAVT